MSNGHSAMTLFLCSAGPSEKLVARGINLKGGHIGPAQKTGSLRARNFIGVGGRIKVRVDLCLDLVVKGPVQVGVRVSVEILRRVRDRVRLRAVGDTSGFGGNPSKLHVQVGVVVGAGVRRVGVGLSHPGDACGMSFRHLTQGNQSVLKMWHFIIIFNVHCTECSKPRKLECVKS